VQAKTKENDKRSRILDAAVRVFAERGFFGATVAEIARAAGVADGTIYLYFKSKDDVLLRLFDEKMTELLAEAKAAAARDPALAQVLIVELRQSAQFLKADGRQKLAAYLDVFGQIVRDGQEAGELDPAVSPQTVKRAIFGALDELALGWLMSGRRTSLKKTAAELSGWLVRGLANK